MSTTNELFILAAKRKYRFESGRGSVSVEDLFDLNLTTLDTVAVALDDKIQKAGRKSFIGKRSASTGDDENRLEIVKFVIEHLQTEAEARKTRADKENQKTFLKGLLEKKQMEQLEGLSVEEIQKQLDQLS